MDVIGGGGHGLAVEEEGLELCKKGRIAVPGLDPDLAPDAVGVDDASDVDGFQFHGAESFFLIETV